MTILSKILLHLLSIDILINIPKWTEVLQAFAAAIGIPLTIFTLYKLVMKDKQRESEIQSLSTIASQLTDMQLESEKRYKMSRKPIINIEINTDLNKQIVKLDFCNTNINSSLINKSLTYNNPDFDDFSASTSTINTKNGNQYFWIALSYKKPLLNQVELHLDYTTEEGYVFIQNVLIWFDNEKCIFSPSPIVDQKNSAINE